MKRVKKIVEVEKESVKVMVIRKILSLPLLILEIFALYKLYIRLDGGKLFWFIAVQLAFVSFLCIGFLVIGRVDEATVIKQWPADEDEPADEIPTKPL